MNHPTYRHLDSPVKLFGLALSQWLLIIACAFIAWLVITVAHLPTPIALWLGVVLIGGPVAATYFSAETNTSLGTLLADLTRWRLGPRALPAPADIEAFRCRPVLIVDRRGER